MPIYEYFCQSCGEKSEILQKMNDSVVTECPLCHQATLQKMLSASAFHLKGAGWYVTDFRNSDKKTDKLSEEDLRNDSHLTISLAFSKEKDMADKRKLWLRNYDKTSTSIPIGGKIFYSDFINKDLIHFLK
jgi:putative FmdB family regulatory protein